MPVLTRWFIKTSFVYFMGALALGVAETAAPTLHLVSALVALGPVYVHLLVVGWLTQLIFGVAYWMFPKYSALEPRGSNRLALACYALLNTGLLLRVVGEPLHTLAPAAQFGWMLPVAALLQWLGGMAFVANTWPRVKER